MTHEWICVVLWNATVSIHTPKTQSLSQSSVQNLRCFVGCWAVPINTSCLKSGWGTSDSTMKHPPGKSWELIGWKSAQKLSISIFRLFTTQTETHRYKTQLHSAHKHTLTCSHVYTYTTEMYKLHKQSSTTIITFENQISSQMSSFDFV